MTGYLKLGDTASFIFNMMWTILFSIFVSFVLITCGKIVSFIDIPSINGDMDQLILTSGLLLLSLISFFSIIFAFVKLILRVEVSESREIRPFVFKNIRESLVDISLLFFGILLNTIIIVRSMEYFELEFSMGLVGLLIFFFHIMGLNLLYSIKTKFRFGRS